MTVTPDAVEAAARALFEHRQDNLELDQEGDEWDDLPPSWQEEWREAAETALAAAAPLIAKQTLLDAAAEFDAEDAHKEGVCDEPWEYATASDFATDAAASWLTARAATLTPKDTP